VETQDTAATGSDQQIVVTARRRNELLLNVPVAVTAYSGEQLNRQGALDITDVADTTPNVTLEVSRGTNSTLTPFIRGIGQQDPVAGFEQRCARQRGGCAPQPSRVWQEPDEWPAQL
jgi:iron complex outermembrane receptor protein